MNDHTNLSKPAVNLENENQIALYDQMKSVGILWLFRNKMDMRHDDCTVLYGSLVH